MCVYEYWTGLAEAGDNEGGRLLKDHGFSLILWNNMLKEKL